ncbi:MAG: glycerophosphodiester phosphodiesterase family protein, partial [Planctomycetia bacterium]|nr:glycerophosphodiester phosphodiesterase family protein [Planctomycetia bacterium]
MKVNQRLFTLFILFFMISPILSADDPVWNIRSVPIDQITVVAHRGAGDLAPENTMEALQLTWGMGGVPEVDIRTSKDGVLVMFHDNNFKRILPTASEEVKKKGIEDLTWAEIQKLDIGSFRGKKFAGQKVVSLAEIIQALKKDKKRKVFIDVKRVDFAKLAEETKEVHPQIILATGTYRHLKEWKDVAPKA